MGFELIACFGYNSDSNFENKTLWTKEEALHYVQNTVDYDGFSMFDGMDYDVAVVCAKRLIAEGKVELGEFILAELEKEKKKREENQDNAERLAVSQGQ